LKASSTSDSPCFSRPLVHVFILLCLFSSAKPTFAGYYSASSIGGTWASSQPYALGSATSYFDAVGRRVYAPTGSNPARPGEPATAFCSGPLSVTYTWVSSGPGDNPPDVVVITETSKAEWHGSASATSSGSCNNGLIGSNALPNPYSPIYPHAIYESYRTTIKRNPGTSFTLSCSPQASVSSSNGGQGWVAISYKVGLSEVFIDLKGVTNDNGQKKILAGQQIIASLYRPTGLFISSRGQLLGILQQQALSKIIWRQVTAHRYYRVRV
jgi:hypothetical protein